MLVNKYCEYINSAIRKKMKRKLNPNGISIQSVRKYNLHLPEKMITPAHIEIRFGNIAHPTYRKTGNVYFNYLRLFFIILFLVSQTYINDMKFECENSRFGLYFFSQIVGTLSLFVVLINLAVGHGIRSRAGLLIIKNIMRKGPMHIFKIRRRWLRIILFFSFCFMFLFLLSFASNIYYNNMCYVSKNNFAKFAFITCLFISFMEFTLSYFEFMKVSISLEYLTPPYNRPTEMTDTSPSEDTELINL
jgi:hypothetical protein